MDGIIKLTEGSPDELVSELLDNESPFFLLSNNDDHGVEKKQSSMDHPLMSSACSGPTIEDVRSFLSDKSYGIYGFQHEDGSETCRTGERGCVNEDNYKEKKKYTLRIKNRDDAVGDDGYKWRKYGQKSIKNRPNPRSYYRCSEPTCNAKKHVERSMEDPLTLIITYQGPHVHFLHSFSLPTTKKHKGLKSKAESQAHNKTPINVSPGPVTNQVKEFEIEEEFIGQQGLLEDIVPFVIRNPLISKSSATASPKSSSRASSPASSNSLFWSARDRIFGKI